MTSKNIATSEPTLESRSAGIPGPGFTTKMLLKRDFQLILLAFLDPAGMGVATANGLEVKIRKVLVKASPPPTAPPGRSVQPQPFLRHRGPLSGQLLLYCTFKRAGTSSACQHRRLSQHFVTSPETHRLWVWPKAGQARAFC